MQQTKATKINQWSALY